MVLMLVVFPASYCEAAEAIAKPILSEESCLSGKWYSSKCDWDDLSFADNEGAVEVFELIEKSTQAYMKKFLGKLPVGEYSYSIEGYTLKRKSWRKQAKWYFLARITMLNLKGDSGEIKLIVGLDGKVFPLKFIGTPNPIIEEE